MAGKPPPVVIPGLNRGAGVPAGYLLGRLPGTGHGPAQLLDAVAMRHFGIATTGAVAQGGQSAVSSAGSTTTSSLTSFSTAISTVISGSISSANSSRVSGDTSLSTVISSSISTTLSTAASEDTSLSTATSTVISASISTAESIAASATASLSTAVGGGGGGGSGALVLITEHVTSGSQATVNFSSISASYRDLEVRVRGRGDNGSGDVSIYLQFNGDTAGNYDFVKGYVANGSVTGVGNTGQTNANLTQIPAASAPANYSGSAEMHIMNYRDTTFYKSVYATGQDHGGSLRVMTAAGQWKNTAAINAVLVGVDAGNFVDGSVVSLYGRF